MTDVDHLVVGSGAGGALTAAHLAEAGRDVLVLEEGDWIAQGDVEPFSQEQMTRQYRNAGVTAALGRPPIAYAEGCCAGGGTEVNSGLYHRPPAELVARWRVPGLDAESLAPHVAAVEEALSIQPLPWPAPPASTVLERGARALGWSVQEVPRWYRYDTGSRVARKQSMTETYLPRAQRAGARIECGVRVTRLMIRDGVAIGVELERGETVRARHVWLCAGAVGTAALLQRSGVRRGVGRTLRFHPTAKLVARFDEPLDAARDVPVHQVKEFGPDLSFGGSASRAGLVALAASDDWAAGREAAEDWQRSAVYYAAIRSQGCGRVLALPRARDPLVTYALTRRDMALLGSGLARLAHLLLAAGATALYPSLRGGGVVRSARDVPRIPRSLPRDGTSLMTVHTTSTVPLGGEAADAHGRLRAVRGVTVNDGSLLPDAPGVNPQGTIMALASRNVAQHLAEAA